MKIAKIKSIIDSFFLFYLKNISSEFEGVIDKVLAHLLFVRFFTDDIINFSSNAKII